MNQEELENMEHKMIEDSDRGITLNKALAWTVSTSLIITGLYIGSSIATLTERLDFISEASMSAAQARQQLELRVRVLENTSAQTSTRFDQLYGSIQELKSDQREIVRLLRELGKDQVLNP